MFYEKTKCKLFVAAMAVAALNTACGKPVAFSRTSDSILFGRPIEKLITSSSSPYSKTAEQFTQDLYDKNTTTVQFRVTQGANNIAGLKKEDLLLTESGININNFTMNSSTENVGRKADIVFVIDDTGSMQPYIDSLRMKVSSFVQTLASSNIQANLCVVTFGDDVHSICSSFVEDDPNTATNENLNKFLDTLSRISTGGGGDVPENQLGALMAAAQNTPWHADAQRIAILMTDAAFHYAPGNIGDAYSAPTYQNALNSIVSNLMMTFAVAPDLEGYSKAFSGMDAFPTASSGGWYNLDDILSGRSDMGTILNSIINQISVMYVAKFVVEDYAGLDPSAPLTKRTISVKLKDTTKPWIVRVVNTSSNLPTGRPVYKKDFVLSGSSVLSSSLTVKVNGAIVSGPTYNGSMVSLPTMPAPGSTIRVEYYKQHLRDNLTLSPITFKLSEGKAMEVVANGFLLESSDYTVSLVEGDTYLLTLKNSLFDDSDPLKIAHFGVLNIGVFEK